MAIDKNDDGGKGDASIDMSKLDSEGLAKGLETPNFGDEGDEVDEAAVDKFDDPDAPVKKEEPKKAPKKEKKKEKEKEPEPEAEEEEPGEEEEEEEEAGAEAEAEEEAPAAKKNVKMVPQARLMHVKTQRDRLEAQLREANDLLRQQTSNSGNAKKAEQFESMVSQLYIDVEKARAAGEVEESAKLQRQLDHIKEEAGQRQSQAIASIEARNQLEQRLYDTTVSQLEMVAPQVNPDADEYDAELVGDLDAATRGYEAQGLSPSEALKRAAKRLIAKDVFDPNKSIRREKQPEPKKTDVKKNSEAIKKMPPTSVKEERPEKTQDLKASQMTRAEFNALPEATQRRMMGDELE